MPRPNKKSADFFGHTTRRPTVWPVHKGSHVGPVQFMPLGSNRAESRRRRWRIYRHARYFERVTRRWGDGKRNGALGYVALAVLHALLFDFMDLATGATFPGHEAIANAAGVHPRSVARAIVRLQAAGFLKWIRRARRLEESSVVFELVQDSNAYYFSEPDKHRPPEHTEPGWACGAPPTEHYTIAELVSFERAAAIGREAVGADRLARIYERGDATDAERETARLLRRRPA